jgi:hypothetical protein
MTTATAQAAANIAFMKYWGMVPENVAVDKLLRIFGIQKQVGKPCSRREQKAIHFSVEISTII